MKLLPAGCVAALFLPLSSVQAQKILVGPLYGYRMGGDFVNDFTGDKYKFGSNPSYGVFLDVDPRESGLRLETLYSFQDTKLDLGNATLPGDGRLRIHNFEVGGLQELYEGRFRPFVAGYVGATWFDLAHVGDDVRFSFTIGLGANYYFKKNGGLRIDARGFGTVVDGSRGFNCTDGGCGIGYSSDLLWQGEATASVFLTF